MLGNVTGEMISTDIQNQDITNSKAIFIIYEGINFMKQYNYICIEYNKKE